MVVAFWHILTYTKHHLINFTLQYFLHSLLLPPTVPFFYPNVFSPTFTVSLFFYFSPPFSHMKENILTIYVCEVQRTCSWYLYNDID